MKKSGLLLIMFFLWPICALADTFQLVKTASGLGVPWGMAFTSDNEIVFTERQGKLGILNVNSGLVEYITGLPEIHVAGQGGLMDVATLPNYNFDDWLYFTYAKPVNSYSETTLARARLIDSHLVDWQDLLVTRSIEGDNKHFGSRIVFADGFVYFSVGERGYRPNAQDLSTHAGSIIRLNLDGSVPEDNPFVDNNQALDEIWSYGHRNPQGLVWDNLEQRLWSIEHGPRGGDEINLIVKGKNYGWPVISYGKEYWLPFSVGEGTHKAGMEQPIKVYVPSIAPGSLLLYSGTAFPEWQGDLFTGALKLRHLNRIGLDDDGVAIAEERLFEDLNERIRALVQSPEGWIYFSTDNGNIYRIQPLSATSNDSI
ncbi:MAG TPA: PQQ-dependent sugar dehydrogenase [Candidatus Thioglobus sp.]|nr:PQQ-dependent sugar dehydrogenase [Candidatus Thioglobus sp.]HIL21623.1 PQQ-dependent sugar dehydrogenase [Candidatus Thioglobus sp.]